MRSADARETRAIEIAGREIPLSVRRNGRARRIVLRIDLARGGLALTLPSRVALAEGIELARARSDWIIRSLDRLPERVAFVDGARIPLLGRDIVIRHASGGLGSVLTDSELRVAGLPEHLARRATDFLKREARRVIAPRAHAFAARLGKSVTRIAMRDTRSRWGSCAPGGRLSFCWRLIFAPEWVLDYVVAHEVAHLVHLNHGPEFWASVDTLGVCAREARPWLDANGERLQRIG